MVSVERSISVMVLPFLKGWKDGAQRSGAFVGEAATRRAESTIAPRVGSAIAVASMARWFDADHAAVEFGTMEDEFAICALSMSEQALSASVLARTIVLKCMSSRVATRSLVAVRPSSSSEGFGAARDDYGAPPSPRKAETTYWYEL